MLFHGVCTATTANVPEVDRVGVSPLDPMRREREGSTVGAVFRVHLDQQDWVRVESELLLVPETPSVSENTPEPIAFAHRDADGVVSVPRFYGLERFGVPESDTLQDGVPLHPSCTFSGTLVQVTKQPAVVNEIVTSWNSHDPRLHGTLAVLPCGFGKTVVAIAAVAQMGRRTCVVVPNAILANQWCERFSTFLPGAAVHVLRGNPKTCKDRCWFVPDSSATIVRSALSLRHRGISFSAEDALRGRKVSLRCRELVEVSVPNGTVQVNRVGEKSFVIDGGNGTTGGVVQITERVDITSVEFMDVPGGCAVRFTRARTGVSLAERLQSPVIPSFLAVTATPKEWTTRSDVVITTVQTLAAVPPHAAALDGFGVLVADEVHSMCARVFSTALQRVPARRMLSLSATPERRDGLHQILPWVCGVEVARLHRSWELVNVRICRYTTTKQCERRLPSGQLNLARMVSDLANDQRRSDLVAKTAFELFRAGRTVIVLSERVEHLTTLQEQIEKLCGQPCGVLCGATPASEREVQASRKILLATYPMCRQGFDKPELDTLIMATPVTSVEQCIGRILRVHPEKQTPLVVDILDPYSIFMGEYRKRRRQYDEWAYECSEVTL